MASKLTQFVETITQALKSDAQRPRHERRSARALLSLNQAQGYEGGYSRLTDFIQALRQGEGQAVMSTAFVPLKFELGDAFQFDWSEEGLVSQAAAPGHRARRTSGPAPAIDRPSPGP